MRTRNRSGAVGGTNRLFNLPSRTDHTDSPVMSLEGGPPFGGTIRGVADQSALATRLTSFVFAGVALIAAQTQVSSGLSISVGGGRALQPLSVVRAGPMPDPTQLASGLSISIGEGRTVQPRSVVRAGVEARAEQPELYQTIEGVQPDNPPKTSLVQAGPLVAAAIVQPPFGSVAIGLAQTPEPTSMVRQGPPPLAEQSELYRTIRAVQPENPPPISVVRQGVVPLPEQDDLYRTIRAVQPEHPPPTSVVRQGPVPAAEQPELYRTIRATQPENPPVTSTVRQGPPPAPEQTELYRRVFVFAELPPPPVSMLRAGVLPAAFVPPFGSKTIGLAIEVPPPSSVVRQGPPPINVVIQGAITLRGIAERQTPVTSYVFAGNMPANVAAQIPPHGTRITGVAEQPLDPVHYFTWRGNMLVDTVFVPCHCDPRWFGPTFIKTFA